MNKHLGKTAALMGGVAVVLGGCSARTPWPVAQARYFRPGYPSAFYLAPRANDPRPSAFYRAPPVPLPEPHAPSWGHDLGYVTAGAALGAVGSEVAKRALSDAAETSGAAGTVARTAPRLAGPVAAGIEGAVVRGAETDALETLITRGLTIIIEDWWWLL